MALELLDGLTFLEQMGVAAALALISVIFYLEIKYRGLGGIPGPLIARYTDAWRCYLAWKYSARPGGVSYHEFIHKKYGTVVRVGPNTVFVNDPAAIPSVLGFKDRLEKTDQIKPFMIPGQPPILAGIRNEQEHSVYRRAIQGVYSLSSLKLYEPLMDDTIKALTTVFDDKCRKRDVINVTQWCHFYAYDAITSVTYGEPLGFVRNAKDMYDLIATQIKHIAYVRLATQWPTLDYLVRTNPLVMAFTPHKESAFFRFSVKRVEEEMQKTKTNDKRKPTMLQHFIDAKEKHPEVMDNTQIHLFCSTNLLAGTLSPSLTLDCILSWVTQHPKEQDRLYREILNNSAGFPVSLEETINMPYLEGVVREGYRLNHGSDIAMERKAGPNGVTLPTGEFIPAGYDLGLSHASIHKDASVFGEQPHVFIPERWMQGKNETEEEWRARRVYMDKVDLTFSNGTRSCIGKGFTQMEVFKVVASILGQFKLEPTEKPKRSYVPVRLVRRK